MAAGESVGKIPEYDLKQEKQASLDKVLGNPSIDSSSIDGYETSMGESSEADCAVVKVEGGGARQGWEERQRGIEVLSVNLKLEKQVRQQHMSIYCRSRKNLKNIPHQCKQRDFLCWAKVSTYFCCYEGISTVSPF